MSLANPVPFRIQAREEKWDRRSFIVTKSFAEHAPDAKGIDFGNAREGAPVYAMDGGTCSVSLDSNGARVVRIEHAGPFASGYAHLATVLVKNGQRVARGQQVGTVGSSGAPGQPHLHAGYTRGGREIDFWPLLAQNQEDDTMTDTDHYPFPEGTRTWTATGGKTTGWHTDGASKVVTIGAGSQAQASETANIKQTPQKAPHGHGFVLIANGTLAGWYVLPSAGTVAPGPKTYTQAELDAAVKDAAGDVAEAAVDEAKEHGA